MSMKYFCCLILVVSGCLTNSSYAQVRLAGSATQSAGAAHTIGIGQLGINNFLGTIGTANGTAGLDYTTFTYGNVSGGRITIDSTSTGAASFKYFTEVNGAATGSSAATAFDRTSPYSWRLLTNFSSNSRILVRASDSTPVNPGVPSTYLDLSNQANLTALNNRLNAIYKFNSEDFIDNVTGAPILPTSGKFEYTFSNFVGGEYRSINLTYTPVPEPVFVGAVSIGLLAGLRLVRRRIM